MNKIHLYSPGKHGRDAACGRKGINVAYLSAFTDEVSCNGCRNTFVFEEEYFKQLKLKRVIDKIRKEL